MSRRSELLAALTLLALALTGCATMKVHSYAERGFGFAQYQTYDWNWDQAGPGTTGDPRLDNNRFFNERVEVDVEKALATKGFERMKFGMPDLFIHYHVSLNQRLNLNGADRQYDYPCETCEPYVYDAGTLLIDFVDSRTNKVVWRGWAEGAMATIDSQKSMEQEIDETVAKILGKFPPRL